MRMSDWSSDVCSSDLSGRGERVVRAAVRRRGGAAARRRLRLLRLGRGRGAAGRELGSGRGRRRAARRRDRRAMTDAQPTLLSPRVLFPFALVTLIWGSTWIVITGQLGVVPTSWSVN